MLVNGPVRVLFKARLIFSRINGPTFSLVFNSEFHAKYLASLTNQNSNLYSIMRFYQKDLLILR